MNVKREAFFYSKYILLLLLKQVKYYILGVTGFGFQLCSIKKYIYFKYVTKHIKKNFKCLFWDVLISAFFFITFITAHSVLQFKC